MVDVIPVKRCPNPDCGFMLVLLEKKRRYKCAKCDALYSQREIDNDAFRKWKEKQKEQDKKDLGIYIKNKKKKDPKKPVEKKEAQQKPLHSWIKD